MILTSWSAGSMVLAMTLASRGRDTIDVVMNLMFCLLALANQSSHSLNFWSWGFLHKTCCFLYRHKLLETWFGSLAPGVRHRFVFTFMIQRILNMWMQILSICHDSGMNERRYCRIRSMTSWHVDADNVRFTTISSYVGADTAVCIVIPWYAVADIIALTRSLTFSNVDNN